MKITRNESRGCLTAVQGYSIPIGTVFDGQIGSHCGPFLRTYDEIVNLEQPRHTWPTDEGRDPPVAGYLPLDVDLIVHGPAE